MAYRLYSCRTDEQWYRFGEFFIGHRKRMNPRLDIAVTLFELLQYKEHGGAVCAESGGETVGCAGYYIGTPEQDFADRSTVLFSCAIALETRSASRLFVLGWKAMIEDLRQTGARIAEIRFHALKENEVLNRMYRKFASPIGEIENDYGVYNAYSLPFRDHVKISALGANRRK